MDGECPHRSSPADAPSYDVDFYADAFILDPLRTMRRCARSVPVVWLAAPPQLRSDPIRGGA